MVNITITKKNLIRPLNNEIFNFPLLLTILVLIQDEEKMTRFNKIPLLDPSILPITIEKIIGK